MLATSRHWKAHDPPLETLEGVQLCQHLDFGLLACRTMRRCISALLSHTVCGNEAQQPPGNSYRGPCRSLDPEPADPPRVQPLLGGTQGTPSG